MWLNRTLCDVLREIRTCHETRNYSYLLSLVEEAQSMGNRMESALTDKREIAEYNEEWRKASKKLKDIRKKLKEEEPDNADI